METKLSTFFHYSPSIATIGTQKMPVKRDDRRKILGFQWVAAPAGHSLSAKKKNFKKTNMLQALLHEKTGCENI